MERRIQGGRRGQRGGIAGLAEIIAEHGEALEYDLMTKARMTLDDLGGALSWRALRSFVAHLDHTSALWRATREEADEWVPWLDGSIVAPLLANLLDVTNLYRWEFASAHAAKGHAKPRRPDLTPVPWRKDKKRHIGRDPIPISEFDDWWERQGPG